MSASPVTYFVAFEDDEGLRNAQVHLDHQVGTIHDIRFIERELERRTNVSGSPVIVSYQLMSGKSDPRAKPLQGDGKRTHARAPRRSSRGSATVDRSAPDAGGR